MFKAWRKGGGFHNCSKAPVADEWNQLLACIDVGERSDSMHQSMPVAVEGFHVNHPASRPLNVLPIDKGREEIKEV